MDIKPIAKLLVLKTQAKLKLLKRQGYGRTGFDLLSARMLAA